MTHNKEFVTAIGLLSDLIDQENYHIDVISRITQKANVAQVPQLISFA